jgi:hypothetical protein
VSFRDPVERVCVLLKLQIVITAAIFVVLTVANFF